jgi:hypothetical protein
MADPEPELVHLAIPEGVVELSVCPWGAFTRSRRRMR